MNSSYIQGTQEDWDAIIKINGCVMHFRSLKWSFVLPLTKLWPVFWPSVPQKMENGSFITEARSGFSAASAGLCFLIISLWFCSAAHHRKLHGHSIYCLCLKVYLPDPSIQHGNKEESTVFSLWDCNLNFLTYVLQHDRGLRLNCKPGYN